MEDLSLTLLFGKPLSGIPRNALNHDVDEARRPRKHAFVAWEDNKLMTCLTTGGPISKTTKQGKSHPNGMRDMTVREFATLQSFPLIHEFKGTSTADYVKQVGNSVPPMIAQTILTAVRKHLERRDKAELEVIAREGRH